MTGPIDPISAAAIRSLRFQMSIEDSAHYYGVPIEKNSEVAKARDFYQALAIDGTPLLLERSYIQIAFQGGSPVPLYVDLVHVLEQDFSFLRGTIERISLGTNSMLDSSPKDLATSPDRISGKEWTFVASPSNGRLDGVFMPNVPPHSNNADSFGAFVLHPWRSRWKILRGAYARYRDDTKGFGASVSIENQERKTLWLDVDIDDVDIQSLTQGKSPLHPRSNRERMWD
jgi:hypothetical protein